MKKKKYISQPSVFAIILIFLLTGSCVGCLSKPEVDVDSEDSHSLLHTTLFTDSTEFFLEYPALVTGEKAFFEIHVTRLSNYKPFTEGEISLQLGSVSVTSNEPFEPGIYRIGIQPENTGIQLLRIIYNHGELTEQVTDSIQVFSSDEEVNGFAHDAPDPTIISYNKELAWSSDFQVQQVQMRPFSAVISASGEMLPVPGEKHHVVARSDGIVLFASQHLVQGSRVTAGELLFTLSGQDLSEGNIGVQYEEARNRYLQSKSILERHRLLYADKILSEREFKESQSRYIGDSIVYFTLSASVSSKGLSITAPRSGYLHELDVAEGQFVKTGQQLATISANQVMLLRADVPQQYFKQLNLIETAHFRPAYSSRTYTIEELKGSLLARGASVAENNHYMPVYFKVSNDGSLLEGAFTEFFLLTSSTAPSLVLPVTAVVEEQGFHYVYVQLDGISYTKRVVTTGENDGLNLVIKSGLLPGERVVTRGAMLLKVASMASSMPAHAHEH